MNKLVNPRPESRADPLCIRALKDDVEWFKQHPDRNYRVRRVFTRWALVEGHLRLRTNWEILKCLGKDDRPRDVHAFVQIEDVPHGFAPPDNDEALAEIFARALADIATTLQCEAATSRREVDKLRHEGDFS